MTAGDLVISKGDVITIDGSTGEVIMGLMPMIEPQMSGDFGLLMGWADKLRKLKVRTNAETPADAETAVRFGCEGIGLCRTEHMFFDAYRIPAVKSEERRVGKEGGRPCSTRW